MSLSDVSYLNQLILQLENGQTLSLLHDGKLRLLPIRYLIPTEGFSFPLRKMDGHGADASHVGSDLPSFIWKGTEIREYCKVQTSYNLLFDSIKMSCNDNELPNQLFLY